MKSIIERLKNNKEAFGLMDEELRRVAEKIEKENFVFFTLREEWIPSDPEVGFIADSVYRLLPNYQCTHPEHVDDSWPTHASRCAWCDEQIEPPKPEYGWVEYEVFELNCQYRFAVSDKPGYVINHYLHQALAIVGFGGISWKLPCDCPREAEDGIPTPCEKHGPATPVSVRFWEVKK
jgi:hypothetical protein